jgi:hypothetical protein
MTIRLKVIIVTTGVLCAIPAIGRAADVCVPEYAPMSGIYLVNADEAASLKLTAAERGTILSTWQAYGEKVAPLYRDFELQRAELLGKLSAYPVSREVVDAVAAKMLESLAEIARMNTDWQRALSVNISVGHMSSLATVRQKGRQHSARNLCGIRESRLKVPLLRFNLNSREKVLITLTEEEQLYLDQFFKHNALLRDEYRSLVAQLDHEISRREPESRKLENLLGLLALNARQDATNAIDCYFYAEANIFTPERMGKLRKYWDKQRIKK